jgi:hypothetical protein
VVAEVHKQAEFVARDPQVIVDLSAVDIVECLEGMTTQTGCNLIEFFVSFVTFCSKSDLIPLSV